MNRIVDLEDNDNEQSQNIEANSQNIQIESAADLTYEMAKEEYDHCIRRSEKLDNKAYILL